MIITLTSDEYDALMEKLAAARDSCDEALDGSWNRSDPGFVAMRDELNDVLEMLDKGVER